MNPFVFVTIFIIIIIMPVLDKLVDSTSYEFLHCHFDKE